MSSADEWKKIDVRDRAGFVVFMTYKFNYGATIWPAEPEAQLKLKAKLVQQWLDLPNRAKKNFREIYKDQQQKLPTGDEQYDRLVKEHFQPATNHTKSIAKTKANPTSKVAPNSKAAGSAEANELKKPEPGFFLYKRKKSAEIQKKLADGDGPKDSQQIALIAGEMWRKESEAVKLDYNKRCKSALDKYFAAKNPTAQNELKKPVAGFLLYKRVKTAEIQKKLADGDGPKDAQQIALIAGEMWRNEAEEVKLDYNARCKFAVEKYFAAKNPTAQNELKKPVTGFFLYKREKTAEIQKKLAGGDGPKYGKQIAVMAGEMWRKESEAVKLGYNERCKADLDVYFAAKKTADEARKKDPNAPKPPLTTFLRFYQANRAKHADGVKSSNDVTRILGAEWKKLTEEEKRPYEEAYRKDKLVYQQALQDYQLNGGPTASVPIAQKPQKAYMAYLADKKAEINRQTAGLGAVVYSQVGSDLWWKEPPEVREEYKSRARTALAAYNREEKKVPLKMPTSKGKPKNVDGKENKPLSPYMRFYHDKLHLFGGKGFDAVMIGREMGKMWQKLSEEQKLPYQEAYRADWIKYKQGIPTTSAAQPVKLELPDDNSNVATDEALQGISTTSAAQPVKFEQQDDTNYVNLDEMMAAVAIDQQQPSTSGGHWGFHVEEELTEVFNQQPTSSAYAAEGLSENDSLMFAMMEALQCVNEE